MTKILTTIQVAKLLGFSDGKLGQSHVGRLIRRKRHPLPATKPGRDWEIKQRDFDKFLAAWNRKPGRPVKNDK